MTLNTKDFPQDTLTREIPAESVTPFEIEVQDPDAFLLHLWRLDASLIADIIVQQAADLGAPPVTPEE